MNVKQVQIYRCDYCGRTETLDLCLRPKGWAQLTLYLPHPEIGTRNKDICKDCLDSKGIGQL